MKQIILSGRLAAASNAVALVDDEDYDRLLGLGLWHLSDQGYAINKSQNKNHRMHREIMQPPTNLVVDHLNANRLDNRRSNLRVCSQKENMSNLKNEKGYTWDKANNNYLVRYKTKHFGRYATEAEAISAYKLAKSGAPPKSGTSVHHRRKYLPKGVYYMKSNINKNQPPFYIRPQRQGVKFFQGYFSTVQEAEAAYTKFLNKEQ